MVMKHQKSVSLSLPFKPPVYRSYWESLQGIYKQGGFRGFYKGNGVRTAHIILFHKLNTDLSFFMEDNLPPHVFQELKSKPLLKEFLLATTLDTLLHPLHLAETRFIMQNRRTNFSVYQSFPDLVKKSWKEIGRGITLHIPRNFMIAMCK